jgi:hypothetical protein
MIGLAGAHRTGKTTLARKFAEKHGWKFAETSVSAIFRDLGHDPSEKFDFRTRLTIQEQILIRLSRFYREVSGTNVITDRTPLDFMAYTMAEAIGNEVLPEDQARFKRYIDDCYEATNRWFSEIIVVQPGIALVQEEGKAALNEAYIEHLNSLLIGLVSDARFKVEPFYIPRRITDLERRIEAVSAAKQKGLEKVMLQVSGMDRKELH